MLRWQNSLPFEQTNILFRHNAKFKARPQMLDYLLTLVFMNSKHD